MTTRVADRQQWMLFSKEGRSLLTLPKHKSDASAQRRVVNGNKECYRIAEVRVMMEVIVACERECSLNEKKNYNLWEPLSDVDDFRNVE